MGKEDKKKKEININLNEINEPINIDLGTKMKYKSNINLNKINDQINIDLGTKMIDESIKN